MGTVGGLGGGPVGGKSTAARNIKSEEREVRRLESFGASPARVSTRGRGPPSDRKKEGEK